MVTYIIWVFSIGHVVNKRTISKGNFTNHSKCLVQVGSDISNKKIFILISNWELYWNKLGFCSHHVKMVRLLDTIFVGHHLIEPFHPSLVLNGSTVSWRHEEFPIGSHVKWHTHVLLFQLWWIFWIFIWEARYNWSQGGHFLYTRW